MYEDKNQKFGQKTYYQCNSLGYKNMKPRPMKFASCFVNLYQFTIIYILFNYLELTFVCDIAVLKLTTARQWIE